MAMTNMASRCMVLHCLYLELATRTPNETVMHMNLTTFSFQVEQRILLHQAVDTAFGTHWSAGDAVRTTTEKQTFLYLSLLAAAPNMACFMHAYSSIERIAAFLGCRPTRAGHYALDMLFLEKLEDSVIVNFYCGFWRKATDAAINPISTCFGNSVEDVNDEGRKSWQTWYLCALR